MNKILTSIFAVAALAVFAGCSGLKEDAKETPIGGAISGETHGTEEYVERVRERNREAKRDVWRPAGTDIDSF